MRDFLFSTRIRILLRRNLRLLCQLVGHCIMSQVRQRSPRCLNKNRRSERSADNMGSQDCSNILMASNNTFLSSSYFHSQDCSNILMASNNTFLSSLYLHFQDCPNLQITSNDKFLSTSWYIFIPKIAIYFLIYTIQISSGNVYNSNIAPNERNAMWTNGLEEHSYRWKGHPPAKEE